MVEHKILSKMHGSILTMSIFKIRKMSIKPKWQQKNMAVWKYILPNLRLWYYVYKVFISDIQNC